jgi:hypothetical protein
MNLIQAQQRIQHLEIENVNLKESNKKLIEEQKEFQDALIAKVQEIKKLGPFKRFLAYGRLLWDLITTIEQAVSKAQTNK